MNNNLSFFNPTTANEMAKFQGNLVGAQSGNAYYGGTATAATSVLNQGGFFALKDSDSGYIQVKKLADSSTQTGTWYDQTFNKTFNFSGAISSNSTNSSNSSQSASNGTTTSTRQTSSTQGYTPYPYSTNQSSSNSLSLDDINGYNSETGSVDSNDEETETKIVNASDIQELVDKGIYDSNEEALNATLQDGYTVPDDEQAKLGIYTPESEEKIQTLMSTYDISREEALEKLGNKAQTGNDVDSEYETLYNNFINNGFSSSDAEQYLKDLGYSKPDGFGTVDLSKYSEEDQAKIAGYMQSTGCSAEDAIKMTGAKEEKPGLIRSFFNGVGDFFGGIGNNIKEGWDNFWSWLW